MTKSKKKKSSKSSSSSKGSAGKAKTGKKYSFGSMKKVNISTITVYAGQKNP